MSEEEWKGREESSLENSSVRHQSQYLVQRCPPQTHVGEAVMGGKRWEVERGGRCTLAMYHIRTYVHTNVCTHQQ